MLTLNNACHIMNLDLSSFTCSQKARKADKTAISNHGGFFTSVKFSMFGSAANTTPATQGICPPSLRGFEPPNALSSKLRVRLQNARSITS